MEDSELVDRIQTMILGLQEQMEKRFAGVDGHLESLERRFASMEDHMEKRFQAIDTRFDSIDRKLSLQAGVLSHMV